MEYDDRERVVWPRFAISVRNTLYISRVGEWVRSVGKILPIELLSMDNGDSPNQGHGDDDDDGEDLDGDNSEC